MTETMPTLDTSCKGLEEERNNSDREFSSRHVHPSVLWLGKGKEKEEYDRKIRTISQAGRLILKQIHRTRLRLYVVLQARSHIILRPHGLKQQACSKPQANRSVVAVGPVNMLCMDEHKRRELRYFSRMV